MSSLVDPLIAKGLAMNGGTEGFVAGSGWLPAAYRVIEG